MRIAIGTSSLPPAAGIGTYVDQIAMWFISQHHDVMVFQASVPTIDTYFYPYPVFHSHVITSKTEEISLSHEQNVITFNFVAFNYFMPEKVVYSYKLEGFDKTGLQNNPEGWNYVGANRSATYTSLPPGKYTFKV